MTVSNPKAKANRQKYKHVLTLPYINILSLTWHDKANASAVKSYGTYIHTNILINDHMQVVYQHGTNIFNSVYALLS